MSKIINQIYTKLLLKDAFKISICITIPGSAYLFWWLEEAAAQSLGICQASLSSLRFLSLSLSIYYLPSSPNKAISRNFITNK